MNDLKNTETFKNLKVAFLNESGLSHSLLFFSRIAEIEGHDHAVDFFKNLAEYAICNSHGNLDFIRNVDDPIDGSAPIGDTKKNLEAVISQQEKEAEDTYANFAFIAHQEGYHDIASWFETMASFKKAYLKKTKKLYSKIKKNGELQ